MYMFERLIVVRLLFCTVKNSRNHLHIYKAHWLGLQGIILGIVNSQLAESVYCATMKAVCISSNNIIFFHLFERRLR